jgi:hypothetical protein
MNPDIQDEEAYLQAMADRFNNTPPDTFEATNAMSPEVNAPLNEDIGGYSEDLMASVLNWSQELLNNGILPEDFLIPLDEMKLKVDTGEASLAELAGVLRQLADVIAPHLDLLFDSETNVPPTEEIIQQGAEAIPAPDVSKQRDPFEDSEP